MLTIVSDRETVDGLANGTSGPDHVRPPTPLASTVGASGRDRTQGSSPVKFAAVYRRFLLESPAVGASPADIGTWVRVLAYASERETEVVPHFGTDREWMSTAGVTLAEVLAASAAGLLTPVDGGLLVGGFDHEGLRKHETLRASGARGGRASSLARASVQQGSTPLLPSPDPSPPPLTKYPEVFEAIWHETGRKGSKFDAHKAWLKAGKPAASVVMLSWKAYMLSDRPVAGFIKDLSTWLNAHGWDQEWPEATNVAPASTGSATRTAYCPFHDSKFNAGKRAPRHVAGCPSCKEWQAANRARESLPESSEQMIKRLGLGS